jgi:hypothetical protein
MYLRSDSSRRRPLVALAAVTLAALTWAVEARAQVHYHDGGAPWNQRADAGPDKVVDGWYYNLGITGLRAKLLPDAPELLEVKHVFSGSPAAGRVQVGDIIVGAGGKRFKTPHRNGYGMDKFGPHGPIFDFAKALEAAQGKARKGKLEIELRRGKKRRSVTLKLERRYGTYAKSFPRDCKKSELVYKQLCAFLLSTQRNDGSWGSPPHDTFAPLALLASGNRSHLAAVEKNVRMHARTTKAEDSSSLINWRYMAAAIVMSEYYLATRKKWVLPELEEVYAFLISSQYTDLSQLNPKAKETHPDAVPKDAEDSHGGWGHNPGFEGYGPICMLTGQGALAFALMERCGVKVDRRRHQAAYAFLKRATGANGYVWYEDSVAGAQDWADMGRTGASGIAHLLSPFTKAGHGARALAHARVIGTHPESFPDTHGSPIMGMGYAALGALADKASFQRLMAANKWWFVLSQCHDGSFYYQPNRDNAGYGADSRVSASAATAFMLSIPKGALHVTGKKARPTTGR